jgi:hypothetical protein
VIVMPPMKMTVMHVVDMTAMRDRDMPAPVPVNMVVVDVLVVSFLGHSLATHSEPCSS